MALEVFLTKYPGTYPWLRQVMEGDGNLQRIDSEINRWITDFLGLVERLRDESRADGSHHEAADLLESGCLKQAGDVLDEILSRTEDGAQDPADRYDRAVIWELQLEPLRGLPHLRKAYEKQREAGKLAAAFARALQLNGSYLLAEVVLERELSRLEQLSTDEESLLLDRARLTRTLASLYRASGQADEEDGAYQSAASIYRALPREQFEMYGEELASSLYDLGKLREYNEMENAIEAYNDSMRISLELGEFDLVRYAPMIEKAGSKLAWLYEQSGRLEEAAEAFRIGLTTYRELASVDPNAYLPYVAGILNDLGNFRTRVGSTTLGEKLLNEALAIYRNLGAQDPAYHSIDIALTLNNLAILHRSLNRISEADKAYEEALSIHRDCMKSNPQLCADVFASALNNLGNLRNSTNRLADAEAAHLEALSVRRDLAASSAGSKGDVAQILNNLASVYRKSDRFDEAEEALKEALLIYRRLERINKATYRPLVAHALRHKGNLYSRMERHADAELSYTEALSIGNSGFVVGERGFGPATALDTVDAPILKPSAFGRGWDLGACVNGGVEGRAGDAPLPPKWLITMGLRQKNRFNECKACGCEPASNHMSGFGFSATDSDSGRRAHGSHERARSARKGRKKHVSVLPRPNRSPWIVVEQNHNGIGKLMVPAFQIYANMNVINDL